MKELVIISGKGGTGKTSILASFAHLAENAVIADCDVDAADLHIVLDPTVRRSGRFSGGSQARIREEDCIACGECAAVCRFEAIVDSGAGNGSRGLAFHIDPLACEGCGVCAHVCSQDAIDLIPVVNGEWYVSDTREGPLAHARLFAAGENSGKLVTLVRQEATRVAQESDLDLILIDGSPGIGCSVIASITGADLVLIVTEPTPSGQHDFRRIIELTEHFGIPACVCVNKWDVNAEVTESIEAEARSRGLRVLNRVRYDRAVCEAQIHLRSVVEHTNHGAAMDITQLWHATEACLAEGAGRPR